MRALGRCPGTLPSTEPAGNSAGVWRLALRPRCQRNTSDGNATHRTEPGWRPRPHGRPALGQALLCQPRGGMPTAQGRSELRLQLMEPRGASLRQTSVEMCRKYLNRYLNTSWTIKATKDAGRGSFNKSFGNSKWATGGPQTAGTPPRPLHPTPLATPHPSCWLSPNRNCSCRGRGQLERAETVDL